MDFANPWFLMLALPWLVLVVVFYRSQAESLLALRQRTSPRFIGTFTTYRRGLLGGHAVALLLAGFCLVCAAASPTRSGNANTNDNSSSVILAIDCSFSMAVDDTQTIAGMPSFKKRSDEAAGLAIETVRNFPGAKFGLISFAGTAVIHSPPTIDHDAITSYLKQSMEPHQQHTGTDFKDVLAGIIRLVERSPESAFQAIIFSDGEEQNGHEYDAELEILKRLRVPVHCVGVGTSDGSSIEIGDVDATENNKVIGDALVPSDTKSGLTNKRESRTCRIDKDLQRIAKATGGSYIVPEKGGTFNDIVKAVERTPAKPTFVSRAGRVDMSWLFMLGFLILFLADNILFDGLRFWQGLMEARRP